MSKKNMILKWKKYLSMLAVFACVFTMVPMIGGCGTELLENDAVWSENDSVQSWNSTDRAENDITQTETEAQWNLTEEAGNVPVVIGEMTEFDSAAIPDYSGDAYVAVNGNIPFFTEEELSLTSYEAYGSLDELGRCGVCIASIGQDLMPTEARGNISSVKPTGWHSVKYDFVDGKYLYNRCHLIGHQLTGEDANKQNLITGTRYLNIEGMLPFENMVADYVKETNQHVMYRVTPVFEGENLVASGVLMEGKSVEDNGEGILFCVFAYNVQPGVVIDYATGESVEAAQDGLAETYILNTETHKFHTPACSSVETIKPENYEEFTGTKDTLLASGYTACKRCNP